MLRALGATFVCIVLGALVVVALSLAMWSDARSSKRLRANIGPEHLETTTPIATTDGDGLLARERDRMAIVIHRTKDATARPNARRPSEIRRNDFRAGWLTWHCYSEWIYTPIGESEHMNQLGPFMVALDVGWPLPAAQVVWIDDTYVAQQHAGPGVMQALQMTNPFATSASVRVHLASVGAFADVGVFACAFAALFAGVNAARRARRRSRGQCPRCGFDRRGAADARCPECGCR